ncbi:hypothetical protein FB45DRAFT_912779 [Roridomyces roridus]|uniref:Uncharacterized protein n=1 Tax=Roridomyces roridus TaxID=1738132 RepID=A0AAD7BWB5_9AGAR|nr:hypothetical protein FB45DRAFT_912779 [Roridomyces roridus]
MSSSHLPLDRRREEEDEQQPISDERPEETPADELLEETAGPSEPRSISPVLPEISSGGDLELDWDSILKPSNPDPDTDKVKKRASNVLKLSQENEKLAAQLKLMSERLEAAERRRKELATKLQSPPSN